MSCLDGNLGGPSGVDLREAEVSHVAQRVAQARQHTKDAQRSAAQSFEKSADCHDRTAASYDRLAEATHCGDDYREHAVGHREFARDDRGLTAQLRRMAES